MAPFGGKFGPEPFKNFLVYVVARWADFLVAKRPHERVFRQPRGFLDIFVMLFKGDFKVFAGNFLSDFQFDFPWSKNPREERLQAMSRGPAGTSRRVRMWFEGILHELSTEFGEECRRST